MTSILERMANPIGQVIFADGGDGKTVYCLEAALAHGWERVLWLNTDRPLTAHDVPYYSKESPFGVVDLLYDDEAKEIRATGPSPVERALEALTDAKRAAKQSKWLYDLVVLDSITELERVNFASHDARMRRAKDKRQVWGAQSGDLQELIWLLRAGERRTPRYLGANVIVTAKVRAVDNPVTPTDEHGERIVELHPAIRGEFGALIDGYYNQVLFLNKVGTNRRLYLKSVGRVHVKNDWEDRVKSSLLQLPTMSAEANAYEEVLKAHGLLKE